MKEQQAGSRTPPRASWVEKLRAKFETLMKISGTDDESVIIPAKRAKALQAVLLLQQCIYRDMRLPFRCSDGVRTVRCWE